MKIAFEKVASTYETVKKSVQEKWEGFKKKFEGTKTEASQEVMNAKTPEDLIVLGKKLQEQGEALKAEEESVKQEETQGENLESQKAEMTDNVHEEALIEDENFDETKATETVKAENVVAEEEAAHEAYVKKTEEDEIAKLAEIRAKLNGSNLEGTQIENAEATLDKKESAEDAYGMDLDTLTKLLKSGGYPEKSIQPNEPDSRKKMNEFNENRKSFQRAEVKLFDKVLSGDATEEEMKIAEGHAADISKDWSLEGFNSVVPKAWYTNERITNAMAEANGQNKAFIEKVKKSYTKDELLKQYKVINEDGTVTTYESR